MILVVLCNGKYCHCRNREVQTANKEIDHDNSQQGIQIEFKTLQNVLYRSQINDVSFMLEDHLIVLMEHQSTINENMPLRLLLYISEIYKGLVPGDLLYRQAVQKIPTPEFFVVYNGLDAYPSKKPCGYPMLSSSRLKDRQALS